MVIATMEERPAELVSLQDHVMSNLNNEIHGDIVAKLRAGGCCADYLAWDFHGTVWFEGVFKCQIVRHQVHLVTLVAESLEEIIREAGSRYGDD